MYVIAPSNRDIGTVSIFDVVALKRDPLRSKMVTVPISGVIPFRGLERGGTDFR